jgi:hypothetical protein
MYTFSAARNLERDTLWKSYNNKLSFFQWSIRGAAARWRRNTARQIVDVGAIRMHDLF